MFVGLQIINQRMMFMYINIGFILTTKRHSNMTEGSLVIFDDDLPSDNTKVPRDQVLALGTGSLISRIRS